MIVQLPPGQYLAGGGVNAEELGGLPQGVHNLGVGPIVIPVRTDDSTNHGDIRATHE